MSQLDGHEPIFPRPLSGAAVERLPSARVPARALLTGRYVQFEPLDPARHASALYQASHGSDAALRIWDYLPEGPWPTEADYRAVMRQKAAGLDPIFYAIRPHDSKTVRGNASFLDINAESGVTEIGYIWFAPDLQRTRAATEALFLMLGHAMDDLGYRRMQWRCNALNAKSRNAAHRLGFRFEGIFFNHMIFKGKNRDTAWCSILDDEWPEIREKIEAWLAPENFDAEGRAKSSLGAAMRDRRPSTRAIK